MAQDGRRGRERGWRDERKKERNGDKDAGQDKRINSEGSKEEGML